LGRSFAACLGCIALSTTIVLGLVSGRSAESILTQSLTAMALFVPIGWVLGQVADSVVRQSVEVNYRMGFEKLRQTQNKGS